MIVENWDSKLELIIEETKNKEKFIRGKNDCVTFVINSIQAITGKKVFDKNMFFRPSKWTDIFVFLI